MHRHMHTHAHTYRHIQTRARTRMHSIDCGTQLPLHVRKRPTNIQYTYVCMCAWERVCMYVSVYVCVYVCEGRNTMCDTQVWTCEKKKHDVWYRSGGLWGEETRAPHFRSTHRVSSLHFCKTHCVSFSHRSLYSFPHSFSLIPSRSLHRVLWYVPYYKFLCPESPASTRALNECGTNTHTQKYISRVLPCCLFPGVVRGRRQNSWGDLCAHFS